MGVDASVGRLFCIFCIRDRFSASNRFKNTDECVLNFRHCSGDLDECMTSGYFVDVLSCYP